MEEQLLVELTAEGEWARVAIRGWVNMDTSEYLADQLKTFVEREGAKKFLIDVRDLEYVSSSGVGVFVDLFDQHKDEGGKIAFVGLRPAVRRVLDLVGFMSFFGDFETESDAITFLRA